MEVLPPAETTSIFGVHLQQTDRRASYRSQPYADYPILFKMLIPLVLRGLNSRTSVPLSWSIPLRLGPLCRLQW